MVQSFSAESFTYWAGEKGTHFLWRPKFQIGVVHIISLLGNILMQLKLFLNQRACFSF